MTVLRARGSLTVQTPASISIFLRRGPRPRAAGNIVMDGEPAFAVQHAPVAWRFARPLGREFRGSRENLHVVE
jgi:hypothetical protein